MTIDMPYSSKQLYVLEKLWKYKPGLKLSQDNIYEVLIRPCNVSYRTYKAFFSGHNVKCQTITHGGCVLSWCPSEDGISFYYKQPIFKTFEEFMIYANVNKCIFPAIENWIVRSENYSTYYVKTIDLKTNEVLYDKLKLAITKDDCHSGWASQPNIPASSKLFV